MQLTFRRLSLVLLPLCCAACSAERSGLAELRRLCEKDAGLSVSRTVRVKGYYDGVMGEGSLRVLLDSNFEFVEFCNDRISSRSLLKKPGCGRYTRRSKGSALCDPRINVILGESVIEPYTSFKKDYCVQLEQLEKAGARYGLYSNFRKWKHSNDSSEFTRSEANIVDARNQEQLAQYVSYSFNVRPGLSVPKSCGLFPGDYPSYKEANLVGSVIIAY